MSLFSILLTISIVLLLLSVIAGIFGFRGVAKAGCLVSRIIFFILVAGFFITVVIMFLTRVFKLF